MSPLIASQAVHPRGWAAQGRTSILILELLRYENYNFKLRNLFGDIIEAIAVMLLRTVKAKIQGVQGKVSLNTEFFDIKGTYDIIIDDKVYDIKSASPFAFEKKFGESGGGFHKISEDDVFGYLSQ